MAKDELLAMIETVEQRLDRLFDQLLSGELSNGEPFDDACLFNNSPVPQTLGAIQTRSSNVLQRAAEAARAAPQHLLPLQWRENNKKSLETILSAISDMENAIETRKRDQGGVAGRADTPDDPRCKIKFGNGSEYDVATAGDPIVQQLESLLARANLVPAANDAKAIEETSQRVRATLSGAKKEVRTAKQSAKTAATQSENLKARIDSAAQDAEVKLADIDAASESAAENAKTLQETVEGAKPLQEQTTALKAELDVFEKQFKPFRETLDETQSSLTTAFQEAERIKDEYSERMAALDDLSKRAHEILSISTTAGLAGRFRQVERRLNYQTVGLLGLLTVSIGLFLWILLVISGFDVWHDVAYYRDLNERLIAAEWGPFKVLAVKLAALAPALFLFGVVFALLRRTDSERRVYTYKRTLAEAAANFADLVGDEDKTEEEKRILEKTFAHLVIDPSAVETEGRKGESGQGRQIKDLVDTVRELSEAVAKRGGG